MSQTVNQVHFLTVAAEDDGQRVDNFIRKRYPGLPKSRIYQMLRKGEVRLNKKRIKPTVRLTAGDVLRMPPIVDASRTPTEIPPFWLQRLATADLYEDEDFLILNKPAGIAVHGGSAQPYGVIDAVRRLRGEGFAELAHRLDRDTSGVLVLGKNRAALAGFQALMQEGAVEKRYLTLVSGRWDSAVSEVVVQLEKGVLRGGERMVVGATQGQTARTFFYILRAFERATLLEAVLDTGRTHQIRVSLQSRGHGIAGDYKYGDAAFNRTVKNLGFHGMFLHSQKISFIYQGRKITVQAPLPPSCEALLQLGDRL